MHNDVHFGVTSLQLWMQFKELEDSNALNDISGLSVYLPLAFV